MTPRKNDVQSMDSLDDLEGQISKTYAQIQSEAARSCCIYAVPVMLTNINTKKAYEPRAVSIGPYPAKNLTKLQQSWLKLSWFCKSCT
jgi:hypothetical protein